MFALPSQRQTGSVETGGGTIVRAAILNWGGAKMSPLLLTFSSEGVVKGGGRIFFSSANQLQQTVQSLNLVIIRLYQSTTVIRFVSTSAKFGICTVVDLNGTLVEDKMRIF